jgi:3-hydroxybutyryl-CoA dehydrogenase
MIIAILADEHQKREIQSIDIPPETEVIWADSLRSLGIIEADAYIDLQFQMDSKRIAELKKFLPKPVIINEIINTADNIGAPFIRINGWPGMLNRPLTEISIPDKKDKSELIRIFESLNRKCQVIPDIAGMVTPRIIAMIINEAFYAESEGVSSRDEIDTAMKLGTNYPIGPFEWAEKIGIERVTNLLEALSRTDDRYTLAPPLRNHSVTHPSPTFKF